MPKEPDWEAMWRQLRAGMEARKDIGDFPLVAEMMDEIEGRWEVGMNDKWIKIIGDAVDAEVDRMCADAGQMTLGELAARLEAADQSAEIQFEDGSHPGTLGSYRGYYRLVAITRGEHKTVASFLKLVQAATGGTFTGYKGGEYTMSRMTPVWVSEYGEASGQGLVGIETVDSIVTLKVARIEED